MKVKTSNVLYGKGDLNLIPITAHHQAAIQQAGSDEWVSLFQGFRLNLQSRITGASDATVLTKLQGQLENVNELEAFFLSILKKPV